MKGILNKCSNNESEWSYFCQQNVKKIWFLKGIPLETFFSLNYVVVEKKILSCVEWDSLFKKDFSLKGKTIMSTWYHSRLEITYESEINQILWIERNLFGEKQTKCLFRE